MGLIGIHLNDLVRSPPRLIKRALINANTGNETPRFILIIVIVFP
jgi:hypothetical protein